ncbi:hypothetical protein [Actinoallomurus sp. NPDC052274]|uniref:hypothetical protein n=1 Tax=Actinoallomurus sp. NPDC052274 TaxID=3155420 RepID=UPI00342195F5
MRRGRGEAAGVVDAVGSSVSDVRPGDAVAVFLPELGGYAGQMLARYWVRVAQSASAQDAAALPASGEAAARVVDEVGVAAGETVLIAGAAGPVGLIASRLAVARGAQVLAAVRPGDFDLLTKAGAMPVAYGPEMAANVRAVVPPADAAQVHRDLENGGLRTKVLLSARA